MSKEISVSDSVRNTMLGGLVGICVGIAVSVHNLRDDAAKARADLNECQTALLSMQDDMAALRYYIVKDGGSK